MRGLQDAGMYVAAPILYRRDFLYRRENSGLSSVKVLRKRADIFGEILHLAGHGMGTVVAQIKESLQIDILYRAVTEDPGSDLIGGTAFR